MTGSEKPLKGKHVLITRGGEQGESFCTGVASAGGVPYMIPLIDFIPHQDINAPLFIQRLDQYDWIIFTSKNGVRYFFEQIAPVIDRFELLKHKLKFAAVGEKTKKEVEKRSIPAHFMPGIYTAEDFAREFFERGQKAENVLIPKGNLASTTIADSFRSRGLSADEWIVYDTIYPTKGEEKLVRLLQEDRLDICAFTSPSTFNHFHQIVSKHLLAAHARKLDIAVIGTVTKRAVEAEGYRAKICPRKFTIDAMFNEICSYYTEEGRRE